MGGTATSATGASASSQQQTSETPEVTAARAKASQAAFARNRAELAYNTAKKEHGDKSAEAQSAKKTLDEAQAEVGKCQGELKAALKLKVKSSKPPAKAAQPKAPLKELKALKDLSVALSEPPKGAYIQHHFLERRAVVLESIERVPVDLKKLNERLEKLLKDLKVDPKTLEYYKRRLNNSEQVRRLNSESEMLIQDEMLIDSLQLFKK